MKYFYIVSFKDKEAYFLDVEKATTYFKKLIYSDIENISIKYRNKNLKGELNNFILDLKNQRRTNIVITPNIFIIKVLLGDNFE